MPGAPLNIDLKRWLKFAIPFTGAVIVGGIVLTSKGEQLKVSAAKDGECIMAPSESVVNVLEKKQCSELHDAEIVRSFEYPGSTLPGALTPERLCTEINTEGLTPSDVALLEQFRAALVDAGYPSMIVTNNADTTKKRDYVCLITFEPRQGSLGAEIFASVTATTVP